MNLATTVGRKWQNSTYTSDQLNRLTTKTFADGTGVAYAPFGDTVISGPSTNPFQFTGRENKGGRP